MLLPLAGWREKRRQLAWLGHWPSSAKASRACSREPDTQTLPTAVLGGVSIAPLPSALAARPPCPPCPRHAPSSLRLFVFAATLGASVLLLASHSYVNSISRGYLSQIF